MEVGSISKWNLKVGDKFEPGTAICEVNHPNSYTLSPIPWFPSFFYQLGGNG